MIFSKKDGGDPTKPVVPPVDSTTYGNPGFRERPTNGNYTSLLFIVDIAFKV